MAQEKVSLSPKKKQPSVVPVSHGVGRRKKSVARIWLYRGSGKVRVNGEDVTGYFDTNETRITATQIFGVHPQSEGYDVTANVNGGGKVGQATAVRLGIARAFLLLDETLRPLLRKHEMLTVDARTKERKKYGQRGARRKFQFVKR